MNSYKRIFWQFGFNSANSFTSNYGFIWAMAGENQAFDDMDPIDLDNFKVLNDTHGHQAGDDALIKVGEIIRTTIRNSDIAARFGGDEFMILIQSNSVAQAKNIAEKIQVKLRQFQTSMKGLDASFGASVGIGYSDQMPILFEDLLSVADKACYEAKKSGKNKICEVKLEG